MRVTRYLNKYAFTYRYAYTHLSKAFWFLVIQNSKSTQIKLYQSTILLNINFNAVQYLYITQT